MCSKMVENKCTLVQCSWVPARAVGFVEGTMWGVRYDVIVTRGLHMTGGLCLKVLRKVP